LNGEGLQHQDGHSQILATTVPSLRSYDPAFAYELAIIVRDGIHRMYELQEDRFYYITLYNENYPMPAIENPADLEEGILRGIYRYRSGDLSWWSGPRVHLLASGPILQQALEAQRLLLEMEIDADVWSVTSFNELYRDAVAAERWNRLHPAETPRRSYLSRVMADESGVFVAATDYMKALPYSIAPWIPGRYQVLGTDGYGMSESRPDLRNHFEIDSRFMVVAALQALFEEAAVTAGQVTSAIRRFGIDPEKRSPSDV